MEKYMLGNLSLCDPESKDTGSLVHFRMNTGRGPKRYLIAIFFFGGGWNGTKV
jgi:hypothetical protein